MDGGSRARVVRAPRGSKRSCLGWQQELPMRMLMKPDPRWRSVPGSVVYGAQARRRVTGSAMQPLWPHSKRLRDDETLLVAVGQAGGRGSIRIPERRGCHRQPISCRIGPRAGFSALWDALGLTMYGQMRPARDYNRTQGILQALSDICRAAGTPTAGPGRAPRAHCGLGGMVGASPGDHQ